MSKLIYKKVTACNILKVSLLTGGFWYCYQNRIFVHNINSYELGTFSYKDDKSAANQNFVLISNLTDCKLLAMNQGKDLSLFNNQSYFETVTVLLWQAVSLHILRYRNWIHIQYYYSIVFQLSALIRHYFHSFPCFVIITVKLGFD